eukprot:jgi/Psemu1/43754/gm1.43754_g
MLIPYLEFTFCGTNREDPRNSSVICIRVQYTHKQTKATMCIAPEHGLRKEQLTALPRKNVGNSRVPERRRHVADVTDHASDFDLWLEATCRILDRNYHLRMCLQKLEFSVCWLLVVAIALSNLGSSPTAGCLAAAVFAMAELYIKGSVASRVVAYAFDCSRALVRFRFGVSNNIHNGKSIRSSTARKKGRCITIAGLPRWLILHHAGVLVQHTAMGWFLMEESFRSVAVVAAEDRSRHALRIVTCLLSMQASHNTWTKSFSAFLYWANAFGVGLSGCICTLALGLVSVDHNTEMRQSILANPIEWWAGPIYFFAFSITVVGMLELVESR